jgi:hypothetical protein
VTNSACEDRPSASFLEHIRKGGVCFQFPSRDAEFYWSSCLADGFQELGIPIYSNFNEHPAAKSNALKWQFPNTQMPSGAVALMIGDVSEIETQQQECARIIESFVSSLSRGVLLCMSDIVGQVHFAMSTPVFVAHANARVNLNGNRIPWAFGLNHHVLKMCDAAFLHASRQPVFLRNFRPSLNQSVRQVLDLAFVKTLSNYFKIDSAAGKAAVFKPRTTRDSQRHLDALPMVECFLKT